MASRLVPQPRIPAARMAAEVPTTPTQPAEPPNMAAVAAWTPAALSFQYADLITVSHHDDATDEAMEEFQAKWASKCVKTWMMLWEDIGKSLMVATTSRGSRRTYSNFDFQKWGQGVSKACL